MKLTKRFLLIGLLILNLIISCRDEAPEAEESVTSPNILLIIADDMGWDTYGDFPGATGTKAHTPTLDSLAQQGVTFTNFWVNPICAPTRAALLTGKYGFRTGVGGVQTPPQAALSSNETIIHRYLKNQTDGGYATALIGKWHVSLPDDLTAPEQFGIDYFSGIFLGAVRDYFDWTQTSNGTEARITTYSTTHLVDQSIAWITDQSQPFFLWLAFNAPHTPFHLPPLDLISNKTLVDDQATIDADPLPYYLAAIEAMDTEIGRLIGSLSEEQKANTTFIILGDNGTPTKVSQAPYLTSGTKGTLYQGGVNVPLIICGKDITRSSVIEEALVHAPDIFATIADLAGTGTTSYQDGISLQPLLTGVSAWNRNYSFTEQFGNTQSSQDGFTIRNEAYKLIHLENGTEYFYQLTADPFESNNLLDGSLSAEAQQNLEALRVLKEGL